MYNFIIVWFDNLCKDFNNDNYQGVSKAEAIRQFYNNHDNNAIIINIIDI